MQRAAMDLRPATQEDLCDITHLREANWRCADTGALPDHDHDHDARRAGKMAANHGAPEVEATGPGFTVPAVSIGGCDVMPLSEPGSGAAP
ncbi:MAG: hypothetical protein JKY00_03455 [Roseicyclus sp.]|nr:hypothetical protein [Roseicyclus sp.]